MMKKTLSVCLLLSVLLVLGLACDSASPVAPSGTLLTVSASPTEIGVNGQSVIRATALRANGTPVNPGTVIRFDTTLGSIDEQAETDDDGVARATLIGDGRIGTATVTARSGTAEAATIDVQVGETASTISLQVTPSSIPETGDSVRLLALVRDAEGQPLPGASVNFSAEIGDLASGGSFITTSQDGTASDDLSVTESDISTLGDDDFEVTVEVGSGASTTSSSFNVRIQRPPDADFNTTRNQLQVAFSDQSTNNPTSWFWQFGDPNNTTSNLQNPTFTYSDQGTYGVTLTVRNAIGEDSITKFVNVTTNQ